jgi:transposase
MPPAEVLYAENLALRGEVAALRQQLAWFKKRMYGGGQGETLDRLQTMLALEGGQETKAAPPAVQKISYERVIGAEPKRATPTENFANLPVKETVVIEPEEVKQEPEAFEKIGEERTFEVDIVPPQMFKREIIRPKYQRREDKQAAPVVAPAPARVMNGGYASAGLIAWILISKYLNHLPLARQEKMSCHWGARLSRQTMVDWVRVGSAWLEPIYKLMLATLLAGRYLQADETPVRCQDPDEPSGKTFLGYMWVVSRPEADVVFVWRNSRSHGELPEVIGNEYKGVLQSDAYAGYRRYAETHEGVHWVACFAHARRTWVEALESERPKAVRVMLKLFANLYRLEKEWNLEAITAHERAKRRPVAFARTLRWMHALALKVRSESLPKSPLGKACDYLLHHWAALTAHTQYGFTKLDTNLVESALRPTCIGKKNFLFIGHPDAGQRSAVIYSLIASCVRHGKDPFAYLRDVLARLPKMKNTDDLSVLLPANWQTSCR